MEYILEMKDISKTFPGVKALDHIQLQVKPGEVHALMGENGAGKSTMMKILMGIYTKDPGGEILFDGKPYEVSNPREAMDSGIIITGVDGTPDGYEAIQDGRMTGTVAQDGGEIAANGIEAAVKLINGEELETTTIITPAVWIDSSNVADYQ